MKSTTHRGFQKGELNVGAQWRLREQKTNRENIAQMYLQYAGIKQVEIARALNLSLCCVQRHTKELRKAWMSKPNPVYPGSHLRKNEE